MQRFDTAAVRAAIATATSNVSSGAAWVDPDIPAEALRAAIDKFAAKAADETPLAFVPSVTSSKAGFLFTDKALYFGEVLGTVPKRITYGGVSALSLDRKFLRINSSDSDIEWNLTDTLLWERSRRKVANVVVPVLQAIIGEEEAEPVETSQTASDAQQEAANETQGPAVRVEIAEPLDWPRILWFHVPIALIGIPLAMPVLYNVIAELGIGGSDFSEVIRYDLDVGQLLVLSASALAPTMYAYGTTLQFSFGRFIVAVAVIAFITLQAMVGAMKSGGSAMPVTLGGGILGIGVASGLGFMGLAIHGWFQPKSSAD